jgi:RNA polymerase sigma-70 factor, ECF subfamily
LARRSYTAAQADHINPAKVYLNPSPAAWRVREGGVPDWKSKIAPAQLVTIFSNPSIKQTVVDEAKLIERIRENDGDALATYIQSRRARLSGLLRLIADPHLLQVMELDDLLQDISASASLALSNIPKDESFDVDAWLEQLARRRVVDAHRRFFGTPRRSASKQRNFGPFETSAAAALGLEQLLTASLTSPSMAVSRDGRLARMQKALTDLSAEQQQMLRLWIVEKLNTRQVAARLSKSDGAIRVLLSRTIKQLESALNDSAP